MANRFQPLQGPDFSGSNALRVKATEQLKQGLNQGVNTFSKYNTDLTKQATQQGLNQIRGLDSRDAVQSSPLGSMVPQYADQAILQKAYDANKVKQQGLYEDDMMQQGMAKIQGIQSLEEYGNTSADAILSEFGQNISADKKTKLFGAFESQDDKIKQQMSQDYAWNQQQTQQAEKPLIDELSVGIQGANLNNLNQIKTGIQGSNISDTAKTSLLKQAEQTAIGSTVLDNTLRTEKGRKFNENLDIYKSKVNIAGQEAGNTLRTDARKAGLVLNDNGTLNTEGMTEQNAIIAEQNYHPLVKAFQDSTTSSIEFDQYLTNMQGVDPTIPGIDATIKQAKADYKAVQDSRNALTPQAQAQYDEDMGIYGAMVQSKISTLNMQKANAVANFQDVSATTREEVNMSLGDATQAARSALQAQGVDIDRNDMDDLMGTLLNNSEISKNEPYVLAEVAKALQIELPFWTSFDDKDFSDADVTKKVKELVVAARSKKIRAGTYLDDMQKWDNQIIDLNTSKLEKSRELTAKLRLNSPKIAQNLYTK